RRVPYWITPCGPMVTIRLGAPAEMSLAEPIANRASAIADARISIRGLGKAYGTLEVFRNVNLEVGKSEIVAIVGPSGCGKTTLLRCIDGLIPPSAGEITVEGERVTTPLPGIAMVFQHFGLFPWKTVYANVAYGLRLAGAPSALIAERVPQFIK